jgi:hypothetical protein
LKQKGIMMKLKRELGFLMITSNGGVVVIVIGECVGDE